MSDDKIRIVPNKAKNPSDKEKEAARIVEYYMNSEEVQKKIERAMTDLILYGEASIDLGDIDD